MYTETSSCTPANGCPQNQGSLPGGCGALAFPFVAMQQQDPPRYDQREALQQGTLFPGLDLPFHKELRSRFPAANNALSELMALDFAIDELGLYLVTHADDQEVLNLYWKYIALAREGRARYQEQYGPLTQTTVTEGGYAYYLKDGTLHLKRSGTETGSVIAAWYDGSGKLLGMRILNQQELDIPVPGAAKTVKIFAAAKGSYAPLCKAIELRAAG